MSLPLFLAFFDALENAVEGSTWAYPAMLGAVALDSVLPVAPGEAVMITAGVLAANGDLNIALVLLAGAIGGFLGDNLCYGLGATLGRRADRRFFTSERARCRAEWARRQLAERGAVIIVAARFIPGGRTATTFSAGTLEMPWRRFLAADAIAASIWSAYAAGLGYFGGSAFQQSLWKPLLAASAVGLLAATGGELLRRAKLT
jgi:membrane protein DedA with SNARE-associated domain